MRSLLVGLLLVLTLPVAATPVGRFHLATVDGVRVPMVWRHGEDPEGGAMQLHWVSGRAEFRKDGTFAVSLTALRTGAGLSGDPESTQLRGTWRVMSGFRIELRFERGQTSVWGPTGRFARLTLKTRYPDLEGQLREAVMVLVRE